MTDTKTNLLDLAESKIRQRGYHAVSFRELADELGIKSASVHYYFRQKEDLGLALIERYTTQFFKSLNKNATNADDVSSKVLAFCKTYKSALNDDNKICLCGVLGAEKNGLPSILNEHVSAFFQANIHWLENALSDKFQKKVATLKAQQIVATLQGAMILSVSLNKLKILDHSIHTIMDDLKGTAQ